MKLQDINMIHILTSLLVILIVVNAGSSATGENTVNNIAQDHVNKTASSLPNADNSTGPTVPQTLLHTLTENKDMLLRSLYVLGGVTAVIILYFTVKTIRLRRMKSKSKKYGVLATADDNMEMRPLDADDDEDDLTVFEVNGRHK